MGQHPRSVIVSGGGCLLCVTSRVLSKGWWLEKVYRIIDLQPKQVSAQGRQGSARMKEEKGGCCQLSGQKGKRKGRHTSPCSSYHSAWLFCSFPAPATRRRIQHRPLVQNAQAAGPGVEGCRYFRGVRVLGRLLWQRKRRVQAAWCLVIQQAHGKAALPFWCCSKWNLGPAWCQT